MTPHPITPVAEPQTDFEALKRGDAIRITFGAKASQVAIVHDRTRAGNIRVWKFSRAKRVWKGPLRLHPGELMNHVADSELRALPPLPAAYRDGAK